MLNLHILIDTWTNGYTSNLLVVISALSVLCGISVIVAKNPIVSVLFLIGLFFSIASYLMALGLNFIGLSYLLVYVGAVSILFLFILMLINVRISELVTDNSNSLALALILGLFILSPIYSKGSFYSTIFKSKSTFSSPLLTNQQNKEGGTGIEIHNLSISSQETTIDENWKIVNDLSQSLNSFFRSLSFSPYGSEPSQNENNIYFVTSKIWDGALGEVSHITSIGNIIYTSYPLWLILTSIILLLAMVGAIVITIKQ